MGKGEEKWEKGKKNGKRGRKMGKGEGKRGRGNVKEGRNDLHLHKKKNLTKNRIRNAFKKILGWTLKLTLLGHQNAPLCD